MGSKMVRKINVGIVILILSIISIVVLYPLVYVVSAAFAPGRSIASLETLPFAGGVTLEHFNDLFTNTPYLTWFKNTLIIAIGTSISTLVVASLAAYVFSRFYFHLKKKMLMAMLILQIFPSFVGMVAIYVILHRIGGLNTLWGLILVYVAGNTPYNVWMVKSYLDTISKNLDEAARIDGANHFRIYSSIILPIAKPILVFMGITSFTAPWMDYIFPKMVLRSTDKQTLALGLYGFVTEKKNEFTNFAAGALLIAIPFIIFFTITQKAMVTSLGGSAVKE